MSYLRLKLNLTSYSSKNPRGPKYAKSLALRVVKEKIL